MFEHMVFKKGASFDADLYESFVGRLLGFVFDFSGFLLMYLFVCVCVFIGPHHIEEMSFCIIFPQCWPSVRLAYQVRQIHESDLYELVFHVNFRAKHFVSTRFTRMGY